jgi:hypothetical protein
MIELSMPLSKNFTLRELVHSNTAERDPALKALQENPPEEVIANLRHLAQNVLQPLRELLDHPIRVTSGYRSPMVNKLVGGSGTSQHCLGEAADLELSPSFLTDARTEDRRREIRAEVQTRIGKTVRPEVDENFYLFAVAAMNLHNLDVDQLIHEYGWGFGRPAWVHISSSKRADKRQILFVGNYTNGKYVPASVASALDYFA